MWYIAVSVRIESLDCEFYSVRRAAAALLQSCCVAAQEVSL